MDPTGAGKSQSPTANQALQANTESPATSGEAKAAKPFFGRAVRIINKGLEQGGKIKRAVQQKLEQPKGPKIRRVNNAYYQKLVNQGKIKLDSTGHAKLIPLQKGNEQKEAAIGEGGQGKVYLASKGASGTINVQKNMALDNQSANEILLMKELQRNPTADKSHVIGLKSAGIAADNEQVAINMSHGGNDLLAFIETGYANPGDGAKTHSSEKTFRPLPHAPRSKIPDMELFTKIANGVCSGVQELHKNSIAHRDIKPENIFINQAGEVTVGDLGLSRKLGPDEQSDQIGGTPQYLPPEVINYLADKTDSFEQGFKADSWAVGCVLLETLTGTSWINPAQLAKAKDEGDEYSEYDEIARQVKYCHERIGEVIANLDSAGDYDSDKIDNLEDLLFGLFEVNPDKRLSMDETLKHPFFNDLDASDL